LLYPSPMMGGTAWIRPTSRSHPHAWHRTCEPSAVDISCMARCFPARRMERTGKHLVLSHPPADPDSYKQCSAERISRERDPHWRCAESTTARPPERSDLKVARKLQHADRWPHPYSPPHPSQRRIPVLRWLPSSVSKYPPPHTDASPQGSAVAFNVCSSCITSVGLPTEDTLKPKPMRMLCPTIVLARRPGG
jgi:hypothetical protein